LRTLAGGDGAASDRTGDLYRGQDIGRTVNRRKNQFDRPIAARRYGAIETKPQRRVIASERHFDRLAGQRSRFAIEQQFGRPRPGSPNRAGDPLDCRTCPSETVAPRPLLAVFAVLCSEISVIASLSLSARRHRRFA
jgi:hypothetical protein